MRRVTRHHPSMRKWVQWYAWYPITTIDNVTVWLENVERRWNPEGGISLDASGYSFSDGEWEYRINATSD